MLGRFWAGGWYAGVVVDSERHPALGLRYTVRTRFGEIDLCDPRCVRLK